MATLMMKQWQYQRGIRSYTVVPTRPQRCVKGSAVLDDTVITVVGKVMANTISYPVESIRMWIISKAPIKWTIANLFSGYHIYLPYTTMNNLITFFVFYSIEKLLGLYIPNITKDITLLATSTITCLLTSLYKVPVTYTLKRVVIKNKVSMSDLVNPYYMMSAYRAVICEDVPELFIKFYLRNYMALHHASMNSFWKALVIGFITTVILTPLEIYKTRVICKGIPIEADWRGFVLRISNSILNTFLFFLLLDMFAVIKV